MTWFQRNNLLKTFTTHPKTTMLTSCNRTAIINSIFQSNEEHLCCITILSIHSVLVQCVGNNTSVSSLLHFAPWLLFNWASVPRTWIEASREDDTRRRGGGKVEATDLWSGRHCQGTTDYKKTGDEEESGHCQSGSLTADNCALKVDKRGAFIQTLQGHGFDSQEKQNR